METNRIKSQDNEPQGSLFRPGLPIEAELCADKADTICPNWTDRAVQLVGRYALQERGEPWTCERFRHWAHRVGLPVPHDSRAFGVVIAKSIRAGLIRRAGYLPAKSSHGQPMAAYVLAAGAR